MSLAVMKIMISGTIEVWENERAIHYSLILIMMAVLVGTLRWCPWSDIDRNVKEVFVRQVSGMILLG